MPLTPGTRIGAYEILEPIGAGGMGEVYRGRDTRLQRDVAIKVVPDLFARDPERLARFEREARTLAALNHPHIAHVYGVEGSALVMEYVDGEDLAQRLARSGPIPMDEALAIALQIADALEAAHDQNIVHRDLKPANIKVRADGAVKVLDFGLAKALAPAAAAAGHDATNSPTITSPFQMSQVGIILGTAAYMAPEQAKGKPADKRADIWAFGCVLFEMLTGTRAFPGEDVTDTLAAIVRAEPEWAALPPGTPRAIRTLLRRCLEKDRRERLPDIGAARLELKDARSRPDAGPVLTAPRRRLALLPWIFAGGATLAAIAVAVSMLAQPAAPEAPAYKAQIIPPAGSTVAPVRRLQISPDGRRLAFVAQNESGATVLWVRSLDDLQAQPLPGTSGAASPFWSADSQWIAFQADGKLKRIEATGGQLTTICNAADAPAGTWNREDVIVLTGLSGLVRVSAAGGPRVAVTKPRAESGDRIHILPFFLPDGRHFLYTSGGGGAIASAVYIGSLDSTDTTKLLDGVGAQYASGHVLFLHGSTLLAQRFDPDRLALAGEPVPLAENIQINPSTGTGAFSVSQNGVLVFQRGESAGTRLTWMDRSGKLLGLLADAAAYADVQLSPDDQWVSATKTSPAGAEIWLVDVARNLSRRFTFGGAGGFSAVWAPGPGPRRLAYASRRGKNADLFLKAIDGTGVEEPLLRDSNEKVSVGFSADGRFLLYNVPSGAARGRLWLLPLADRRPRPLISEPTEQASAEISPDGRWIAYVLVDESSRRVYVASFPDVTGQREISPDGGETPRWRQDGKELFFTNAGKLMAVDIQGAGATIDVGAPHVLFDVAVPAQGLGTRATFAVSRDGQRFLFNTWDAQASLSPIVLIVNWPRTLDRSPAHSPALRH